MRVFISAVTFSEAGADWAFSPRLVDVSKEVNSDSTTRATMAR